MEEVPKISRESPPDRKKLVKALLAAIAAFPLSPSAPTQASSFSHRTEYANAHKQRADVGATHFDQIRFSDRLKKELQGEYEHAKSEYVSEKKRVETYKEKNPTLWASFAAVDIEDEAGEELLRHARKLLDEIDKADWDFEEMVPVKMRGVFSMYSVRALSDMSRVRDLWKEFSMIKDQQVRDRALAERAIFSRYFRAKRTDLG